MKTSFTTMKTKTFLLSLILYFAGWASLPNVQAQDTDFWFVAPDLALNSTSDYLDRPVYFVITAGDLPATVTMTMPAFVGNTPMRTIHVGANQSQQLFFGNNAATSTAQMDTIENTILTAGVTGVKYNRGIHFTSDNPVFIYYALTSAGSKAIFALKGKKALGNSFYIPAQQEKPSSYNDAYPQFHVVASEDNTVVTITPTSPWYGGVSGTQQPANNSITVTLNRGETFAVRSFTPNISPRFAGSTVTVSSSNTPVAVTVVDDILWNNGETSGGVTYATGADATGDQIVPINNVGKKYVIVRGYTGPSQGDYIYIMATKPNTNVTVTPASGAPVTTSIANAGDFYMYHLSNVSTHTAFISADEPVYVWQVSGINGELDAVLVPSMYSINGRSISFYKEAAGWHRVFILARSGNEGNFLVNGVAGIITAADFQNVTGVTGWKYARKDLTSSIPGLNGAAGTVKITNATGPFSLGYFFTGTTSGSGASASFGYLSAFGDFSFPEDTVYKCAGSAYTLDGGYALDYLWTLPDGSAASTATIAATQTGKYKLTVNQDPAIVTDSIWILDRFAGNPKIVSSGGNDVGAGNYTYSVDLDGQSATNISYVWKVDGVQVSTAATYSATWTNTDEHLITVEITDDVLGCTKTLNHVHHKPPDNISDASCFVTPDPINFSIKSLASTTSNDLDVLTTPLIGDVDNDGEIEILHPSRVSSNSSVVVGSITELRIYGVRVTAPATPNAPQLYPKYTIPLVGNEFLPPGITANPTNFAGNTFYTFAKVDPPHPVTGKQYAAIFLATISGKLYKYEFNPTSNTYEETYSVMFNPSNRLYVGARPVLADLMSDGHVQVCILDKIYDAENLTLLATLRDAGNNTILPTDHTLSSYSFGFIALGVFWNSLDYSRPSLVMSIDDTDNDGKKEIIAGDCVYKVNITSYSGEAGNTYRLAVRANKQADLTTNIEARTDIYDGCGVIIDVDLDGRKDVVVVSRGTAGGGKGYIYAYDPLTGQVKNTSVTSVTASTSLWNGGPSFPFIGDIDNDKYPEICFGANANDLYAFKYNPVTKNFVQFWHTTSNDGNGCVGLSLFDFEQDNQPEIIYRDQDHLYIWDGSQNPPVSVNPPMSGGLKTSTASEYPAIADVNGDGFADIIVTGGGSSGYFGNLRIFTSDGAPWAPARSVWHMSPSQPLYINDDLTIPRYPISPTTVFPGADGDFSTASDNVRPFNNYMQQATALNRNGNYLWLAPDAKFAETPVATYYGNGDSLVIAAELTNIGDAALNTPFYISAYKDDATIPANKMATDSSMISLNVEDAISATVTIRNFSSYAPLTNIILRINDKGASAYVQQECNYDNNVLPVPFADLLMAHNDYSDTIKTSCDNMPIIINVLANDSIPDDCTAPVVSIVSHPAHVTATVNQNKIEYSSSLSGSDTLVYRVTCGTNYSEAKVRVIVEASGSDLEFVDDLWYFGQNTAGTPPTYKSSGIRFVKDGSGQYVAQDASGESSSYSNSLIVSSPYCGNIFYLSNSTIYNSEHEMVENGTFDGDMGVCDGLAACYMGDNKYLFFSVTNAYNIAYSVTTKGLMVYAVDMSANNGKGARILSVERTLETVGNNMSESVELVARAGTTNQYWLIYAYCNGGCSAEPYSNEMRVRLVDVSDPTNPQISAPVSYPKASGYARQLILSQQHNRLALAHRSSLIEIFDFDNSTGVLSNRRSITESGQLESVEFSPDGNQLYFSEWQNRNLWQYDISSTTPAKIGTILYEASRGGGFKLGLDGKIYVAQANTNKVGVISDPNLTTPLSSRYNGSGLILSITYYAHIFSTNITQPAVMPCTSTNTPPSTQNDSTIFCVTPTSRTAKANVLLNDSDADNNTIYLRSARFVNPADEALADISVNAADSTVTLTLKNDANIGAKHVFEIIYNVKDNGTPMSQCATGIFRVKAYSPPSYPDLRLRVCPDAGSVNLAKYIDTTDNVKDIQWTSQISGMPISSPDGVLSTSNIASARTYTFTYTITSRCVADQTRKVYLEVIKNGNVRRLRDTIVICNEYADAVQINQIFGIESGAGDDWLYHAVKPLGGTENIDAYVSESIAPSIHAGSVVMNGKAIYGDNSIPYNSYHGLNNVKIIKIIYKAASGTCLEGKEYTKVIVLTGS